MDLPSLDELEALIRSGKLPAKEVAEQIAEEFAIWAPQEGPQTQAYFSLADELLYGGAAGGGKTDLLLGLAFTAHRRSLIFRNQSTDLSSLFERALEIIPVPAKKDMSVKSLTTPDGRKLETGHLELPGSERSHMGRPKDLIGFDEAALLDELRVNFVGQWLRSTDPKQRKRIVYATNPPIPEIKDGVMTDTAVGDWLNKWFAPWLDPTFHNPAEQGELRWCYMQEEGDRLVTIWVDGPGYYERATGEFYASEVDDEEMMTGRFASARSRTFIRSLAKDNVFLRGTGYIEKLSSQPEPLRSMLMRGDFTIKGADHPFQVIPTQWVLEAQERWEERTANEWDSIKRLRQLVLFGDIAQGGADSTVLAPLYETDYFDELTVRPGSDTPTGEEVQALIILEHMDNSIIALDGTGGWAGSTRDLLKRDQNIDAEMFIASASDGSWDPMMNYKYLNYRAMMWWQFRLALDPKSEYDICLPPSIRLRAQLTTPHFIVKGKVLQVEDKEQIRKRLKNNSSTDEADAVLGAWHYRDQAIGRLMSPEYDIVERLNGRAGPEFDKRKRGEPLELDDPRGQW
jgi:hypothetical protein